MSTFLGIPRKHAAQEESPLRGTLPFPKAARRELAQLRLENDILKKTAAYFAKESL